MRELEKKAEELQYQVDQEYCEGDSNGEPDEETEEQKRMRVKKELEKIQIWLAMAYEANNRHADCIDLYQQLEKRHPSVSIRRQAAELRYILQAPKLKISQEEMVTIPLIGSTYDSYAATWSDKNKDKDERMSGSTSNQLPSDKDYLGDFMVWKPPVGLEKNSAFWVLLTLWIGLVAPPLSSAKMKPYIFCTDAILVLLFH
ncbi:hypothetical protein SASPL_156824 [Salvia splendens]|uniref:Uncharacterized protein n=1 Tax=Salvia splendens TaxID=180675 RepID=A0A8X8VVZ8_SALSN|nr:hypothetical protein SASPL_156824 [Salvia splendens]